MKNIGRLINIPFIKNNFKYIFLSLVVFIILYIIFHNNRKILSNIEGMKIFIEYISDEKYSKNPKDYAYYDLPNVDIQVDTTYSAIIVEPRRHKALEFVLNNFLENLDEQWTIIVIHGNQNSSFLSDIIETKLSKYKYRIQTINLNLDNLSVAQYSELFYNDKFYDYIPTEMFLIFQTDSMIFKKNRNKIYNFMEYDYVGAPWIDSGFGPIGVGNGGLSLRRKSKMIELLKYKEIGSQKRLDNNYGNYLPEDRFFNGFHIKDYVYINLPSVEKASEFSVEAIYNKNPFGVHKPWLHLTSNELNKLIIRYPELKTLVNYNIN